MLGVIARLRQPLACAALLCVTLLPALTGCAWREYRPAPLDLPAGEAAFVASRLDDADTRGLLEHYGVDTRDWPDLVWTRETLLVPLVARHPELRAARSRAEAAAARVAIPKPRPNPELSTTLENHSASGTSPWSVGAALSFSVNSQPLRNAQIAVAGAEARDAALAAGEVAWRLYRALGDALLEQQAAESALRLADDALALAQARSESVAVRQRYGVAAAVELQLTNEALIAVRRERAVAEGAVTKARARLAQALAVPVAALDRVRVAPWPVLAPDAEAPLPALDAADARAIALRNRLDLARELARYEVAEADVRLEVARQYPQVRLSPGLLWDQGDRVWQLGLSLPLQLFQRNRAAIDAAEARRTAQAQTVLARQSAIASEIESLRQAVLASDAPIRLARLEVEATTTHVQQVQAQFDAGAADALTLINARGLALQARRHLNDAGQAWRQAQWALETGLQSPLPTDPPHQHP